MRARDKQEQEVRAMGKSVSNKVLVVVIPMGIETRNQLAVERALNALDEARGLVRHVIGPERNAERFVSTPHVILREEFEGTEIPV